MVGSGGRLEDSGSVEAIYLDTLASSVSKSKIAICGPILKVSEPRLASGISPKR